MVRRSYVVLMSTSPPANIFRVAQNGHECRNEASTACIHVLCRVSTERDLLECTLQLAAR